MTPLGELLAGRIAAEGAITVHDFMDACLTHPEHGYYRWRDPLGAAGDFTTAPEISQMFGELIGVWAVAMWSQIGRPARVFLVELGPGRGTLMADALRAIGQAAPEFAARLAVHLVEINPHLRARQAAALGPAQAVWHAAFGDLPPGPAIIIANEYFDALPIRQFVRAAGVWRERMVTFDAARQRFAFALGPEATQSPSAVAGDVAPEGSIAETCPAAIATMREMATHVLAYQGAALVIDYGPLVKGLGDTLQAVRRHRKVDPLAEPGIADLTAHVDFTALADIARGVGAAAFGPLPQGIFLQRLGIGARAATLLRRAGARQARDLATAARRLIDASEMGTLFKVLAITGQVGQLPTGLDPVPELEAIAETR